MDPDRSRDSKNADPMRIRSRNPSLNYGKCSVPGVSLHEVQQEQRRRPKKIRLEPHIAAKALQHGEDVLGFETSSSSESEDDYDVTTSPYVTEASTETTSVGALNSDSETLSKLVNKGDDSVAVLGTSSAGKKDVDIVGVEPTENGRTSLKDRDDDLKPEDMKAADSFKEGSRLRSKPSFHEWKPDMGHFLFWMIMHR